jgi:hypothetical protein
MSDHMYIESYMAYAHKFLISSPFSAWWPLASRGRRIYIYTYIYIQLHTRKPIGVQRIPLSQLLHAALDSSALLPSCGQGCLLTGHLHFLRVVHVRQEVIHDKIYTYIYKCRYKQIQIYIYIYIHIDTYPADADRHVRILCSLQLHHAASGSSVLLRLRGQCSSATDSCALICVCHIIYLHRYTHSLTYTGIYLSVAPCSIRFVCTAALLRSMCLGDRVIPCTFFCQGSICAQRAHIYMYI